MTTSRMPREVSSCLKLPLRQPGRLASTAGLSRGFAPPDLSGFALNEALLSKTYGVWVVKEFAGGWRDAPRRFPSSWKPPRNRTRGDGQVRLMER